MHERLSPGEQAFEDLRRSVGKIAGPIVALTIALAGPWDDKRALSAVLALAAIWWITEAVPVAVTALLATVLVVVTGVAPPKVAFAAYGSPLLFLFVGSFFIAEAMREHGVGDRVAGWLASRARGRLSLLVVLGGAAFVLSMWMSNSAATAVLLPIAVSVADRDPEPRYASAVVLAIAYGASVGGMGTPVGTPPNLIGLAAMREAGIDIGFFTWMTLGIPLGLVMMVTLIAVLAWRFGVRPGQPLPVAPSARPHRPWTSGEIGTWLAFGLAVLLWLTPGAAQIVAPGASATGWLTSHLTEEVVALTAATLLFLWPAGGRPALTWREAQRIDWSTVLLFGGGILLGDLAGKTGLTAEWGEALVAATGADSSLALTALVVATSIVLSEATSNTATATLMVPLAVSMATAMGVSPIGPALGATLGASFGFMMPVSTAPNAMAYGTGRVTIRQMASTGIVFDVLGAIGIVLALALWL